MIVELTVVEQNNQCVEAGVDEEKRLVGLRGSRKSAVHSPP
jgi:hypothetical protein